jgi:hypothetical protein
MKSKLLAALLSVIVLCGVTYLVAEGIYSIVLWDDMDGSLAYKTYDRVAGSFDHYGSSVTSVEEPPADLPTFRRLATRARVEALIPEFVKAGIAIGNVPRKGVYKTDVGDVSITTRSPEGCEIVKPNLHKTMIQVRSNDYRPLVPPTLFFNDDATLSDDAKAFISNYGVHASALHTNDFGERVTVPTVISARKVLVAGDSLAFGASVDDRDTLASQLQRQDSTRQYVTAGIPGGEATDVVCAVEGASKRYHGQIDSLIYFYSPTDLSETAKYGMPEEFLKWLQEFVERENIADVTVIFGTNFKFVTPHLFPPFKQRKDWYKVALALRKGTLGAGYKFISVTDLALEEASNRKTDFAPFAMFMDAWGHLSPYGTSILVDTIRNPQAQGKIGSTGSETSQAAFR